MEKNSEDPLIEYQQLEIKKIAITIAKKYQLYDKKFAYKIAEELYNNGIHSHQCTEEYYQAPFNLDEIIRYFIQKKSRETKIKPINLSSTSLEKNNIQKNRSNLLISHQRKKVKTYPFRKALKM